MNTSGPLSPKVIAFTLAGILVTSILANITFITPGMLANLGPWAPFVYGTASTILGALVGWFVKDPLRQEGILARALAAQNAPTAPPAVPTAQIAGPDLAPIASTPIPVVPVATLPAGPLATPIQDAPATNVPPAPPAPPAA